MKLLLSYRSVNWMQLVHSPYLVLEDARHLWLHLRGGRGGGGGAEV
jgi:hypothetical protein